MIDYGDIAVAIVRFADQKLRDAGEEPSAVTIDFPDVDGAWETPHVEATITMPKDRAKVVHEALVHGAEAVNRLVES